MHERLTSLVYCRWFCGCFCVLARLGSTHHIRTLFTFFAPVEVFRADSWHLWCQVNTFYSVALPNSTSVADGPLACQALCNGYTVCVWLSECWSFVLRSMRVSLRMLATLADQFMFTLSDTNRFCDAVVYHSTNHSCNLLTGCDLGLAPLCVTTTTTTTTTTIIH